MSLERTHSSPRAIAHVHIHPRQRLGNHVKVHAASSASIYTLLCGLGAAPPSFAEHVLVPIHLATGCLHTRTPPRRDLEHPPHALATAQLRHVVHHASASRAVWTTSCAWKLCCPGTDPLFILPPHRLRMRNTWRAPDSVSPRDAAYVGRGLHLISIRNRHILTHDSLTVILLMLGERAYSGGDRCARSAPRLPVPPHLLLFTCDRSLQTEENRPQASRIYTVNRDNPPEPNTA
ncbi:hypothetical protein B0H14DRAFT_3870043 [Mycena olivaceomarginata]|nr:hypothetical protein B0H14DRAFT_3870043 [Mycena olivaceomarginata]